MELLHNTLIVPYIGTTIVPLYCTIKVLCNSRPTIIVQLRYHYSNIMVLLVVLLVPNKVLY